MMRSPNHPDVLDLPKHGMEPAWGFLPLPDYYIYSKEAGDRYHWRDNLGEKRILFFSTWTCFRHTARRGGGGKEKWESISTPCMLY
ncbi:hypothetical protein I7I50_10379 [Histoplasma capsulatum G186AR]|uniref:Uncharacterized protein n=1 Tax=Ajellomyces capsulatus TaxID=5037 RepID=A0A8H7Z9F0_AJECA|nr:hypothetical protein I7I52_01618 [Histoplasma capsulatum]QSS69180.1 hypothetical protein I7I50_10379 [Histoplasma capsulatum G186AR]